jgi:hypothetical protein
MPCYSPITGYLSKTLNSKTGKRSVVFHHRDGFVDLRVSVPCGKCIGCRLNNAREWAVRCVHEASLYDRNCFITLTFDTEHLNAQSSLRKADFQLFMKRLRKKFGSGVRYFHCGEYGSKMGRPHYHACLFNFDFPDRVLWDIRNGVRLYRSAILESLWPFGFCTVGDVTVESAAYVARYVVKKIGVVDKDAHYQGKLPEYTTMSRRPGIGKGWYDKWKTDVFPNDFIVVRGQKFKVPKYYSRLYDLTDHNLYGKVVGKRMREAVKRVDSDPRRFSDCAKVAQYNVDRLVREYEK